MQGGGVPNREVFQEVDLNQASYRPPSPPQQPPPLPPPQSSEAAVPIGDRKNDHKTSFASIKPIAKTAKRFSSFRTSTKKDLVLPTKQVQKDHSVFRRTKSFITRKHSSERVTSVSKQTQTISQHLPTLVNKHTQTYVDTTSKDKVLYPTHCVLAQRSSALYEEPVYYSLTTKAQVHCSK